MPKVGIMELVIILVIVVMIFGGKRIPELAKGMGEGIKNFKKSMKDDGDDAAKDKKV